MDFLADLIQEYSETHSSPESPLLQKISRETHLEVLNPRMLSGHLQGRILAFFSKMMRPRHILEIGTYTGYSAICLAEGLSEGGKLYTIEANEELEKRVKGYFKEAQLEDKIDFRIGKALDIIPQIDVTLDLVFIDADKPNYGNYFDLVINKVRQGGLILADNVLWSGKVVQEAEDKKDKSTGALKIFNQKVQTDPRVENLLLPLRDGLMIAIKL